MQLVPVKLLFSPFRIAFLVFWFYLCMYVVQRFEFSPIVPKKLKASMNILMLFFGPLVLFVFIVAEAAGKILRHGVSFADAVRGALGRAVQIVDISHFSGARGKSSLILLDASGKDLFEVYGNAKNNKEDKNTLEHTQRIVSDAVDELASDILIDPVSSDSYSVRYRIDGMLRTVEEIDFRRCAAIVNSIKAISNMDISERRRPQDGAFIAKTSDGSISFRVASAGVLNGEKLSIRVLNQAVMQLTLGDIGMSERYQRLVRETLSRQSGMILVCGPTGSGKSTTMQAMLSELDFNTRNVITIEDPIEYVLPRASQIEINSKAGITFAKTLRSVLRQDPDVIGIGEIRDEETASIALAASQTGHLVLATLHSSSNAATIVRLMDLGIKPLLVASAIDLIISQRLVRKLCPDCMVTANLTEAQIETFRGKVDITKIMQIRGCSRCGNTGYKGRIGIFDIMVVDEVVKAQILSPSFSVSSFKNSGDEQYKTNLRKQAMKLALSGTTSLEEVKRVTANLG
ncbi:MAG: GspE/PulE family protein [Phycisphaerae bacterium]|nr:GspE/PulE family protein [Phycisphaerae bacterium]